jgi:hypothetical protein
MLQRDGAAGLGRSRWFRGFVCHDGYPPLCAECAYGRGDMIRAWKKRGVLVVSRRDRLYARRPNGSPFPSRSRAASAVAWDGPELRWRNVEAKGLRGLEIDGRLELG